MYEEMNIKKLYWSRRPGQYLDKHTGDVDETKEPTLVMIGDWYNTLVDLIFENTTSNQNVMVFSRDIQTLLEHTIRYRAYLEDLDPAPAHGTWPADPENFKLFGFLSNNIDKKEGWVNFDSSDHSIRILDLNDPLDFVEIVCKGFPDYF
jgi:hypothetical protein